MKNEDCAYYHCEGDVHEAGVCEQHWEAEECLRKLETENVALCTQLAEREGE